MKPSQFRLRVPSLLALGIVPAVFLACDKGFSDSSREFAPTPTGPNHSVTIHSPESMGVVDTNVKDVHGTPVGVACATCHSGSDPMTSDPTAEAAHEDLVMNHGELSCTSCHDASDQTLLHLADGETLELNDAMRLCAQCHGVQVRDYEHGSHGGMAGYWDLTQGPRTRNHCLDCHGAHEPQYGQVLPVHPPRDRYFGGAH